MVNISEKGYGVEGLFVFPEAQPSMRIPVDVIVCVLTAKLTNQVKSDGMPVSAIQADETHLWVLIVNTLRDNVRVP